MGISNTNSKPVPLSPACSPLAIGNPGDVEPSHQQVIAIITTLRDAGICCCFVQEFALIYYGAHRVANDRVLCVPDSQLKKAAQIFASNNNTLEPCKPHPCPRSSSLDHHYPRFKAIGRTDFWLLTPASYCHIACEPRNIEWSKGHLPYPKLPVYVQSLLDTKNGVDLEDLVDGMNLSEQWGEENLNLEGVTDTKWLENTTQRLKDDGVKKMFIFIDPRPVSRLKIWQDCTRTKQSRMGWKYSTEIYATRFRRFGSRDPRLLDREGV